MSARVPVYVSASTHTKLQRLAVLAGDESAAIDRLIAHWEQSANSKAAASATAPAANAVGVWHSASGDVLPIGERLEGTDAGKTHYATIEREGIKYAGKVYDSPSAAARAVKEKRGLTGSAATTNGREFWKLRDPRTNRLLPISALRPASRISADELLAEIGAQR